MVGFQAGRCIERSHPESDYSQDEAGDRGSRAVFGKTGDSQGVGNLCFGGFQVFLEIWGKTGFVLAEKG